MNYYSKNDSSEYTGIMNYLAQNAGSIEPEEYLRLKRILASAKGNVTRRNRLEAEGVDTEALLDPMYREQEPGGIASLANELKPYGRKAMSTLGVPGYK